MNRTGYSSMAIWWLNSYCGFCRKVMLQYLAETLSNCLESYLQPGNSFGLIGSLMENWWIWQIKPFLGQHAFEHPVTVKGYDIWATMSGVYAIRLAMIPLLKPQYMPIVQRQSPMVQPQIQWCQDDVLSPTQRTLSDVEATPGRRGSCWSEIHQTVANLTIQQAPTIIFRI